MKKNIFTGNYDPLTEKDYTWLRERFLYVFIKGTYKKRSLYEKYGYGMFGTIGDGEGSKPKQPRIRKRFLAEENYGGKYQPKSIHPPRPYYETPLGEFMVIGRYYTENLGYKHYRVQVIFLSGSKKGRIGYVTA